MTLDRKLDAYREIYDGANDIDRDAIDEAFDAAFKVLKKYGYHVPGDDRSENVVTAIVKYLVESRNAL